MAEQPADGAAARLAALRESGVQRSDPVRFAYLEALARRAAEQPEAIRRPLTARILNEADALAARRSHARTAAGGSESRTASPLAELLAYIGQHAIAPAAATQSTAAAPATVARPPSATPEPRSTQAPELKSVAYFRDTWSRLSTEQQLTQTLAQAPENAGPMNSQHLVLRSLQVMRDLSPDYLQGFMSYIDTLVWLEQASPLKPGTDRPGEGEKKAKTPKRGSGKR
jgi:hypothetical protein